MEEADLVIFELTVLETFERSNPNISITLYDLQGSVLKAVSEKVAIRVCVPIT